FAGSARTLATRLGQWRGRSRWRLGRLGRRRRRGWRGVAEQPALLGNVEKRQLDQDVGISTELVAYLSTGGRGTVDDDLAAADLNGSGSAPGTKRTKNEAVSHRQHLESPLDLSPE